MKLILSQVRYFFHLLKQAVLGKEKKFTTGSINRAIVLLSVPMVLEMVMESLFVCSNLFFVSRLGAGAIAIVGATESVISFSYSIAIGLSIAASSVISRRIGEKKFKAAGATAMQIIYIGLSISLIVSILCVVFYKEILLLVGMPEALVIEAEWFAKIMFASILFIILRISVNGIFRGAGNAAIAMRTLWLSNTVNIVLCPVLIFGWGIVPAYGILGVALATAIARVIGVLYQAWHLIRRKTILSIGFQQLKFSLALTKKVLKLAITGAVQYMIPSSSWILMIKIVSYFGPNALAGYIIAQRVASIATMPAWGIGNAAGILTGQNLGANQHARAEKSVWKAGIFNTGFLCLVALFWAFGAEPVILLFTDEPEVLKNGVLYLNYITIAYVLLGYTMVISRALNAAGDVKVVTLLYILMFYVTQIPLSYLFGIYFDWGPKGIFTAILTSELVLAAACITVFRKGKWKHIKV
ncbi:MATE family efflux transporter [Rapidithrix thailandica]|uniref:Multidrug-efflux transporter n=1 Tax=Rapidithrix thailandica TaxID=413964 RepID=A0AAW9S2T0_9BACT